MEGQTGGPAFGSFKKVGEVAVSEGGLTVRDWFAGQALPALITRAEWPTLILASEEAYKIADDMLKERER